MQCLDDLAKKTFDDVARVITPTLQLAAMTGGAEMVRALLIMLTRGVLCYAAEAYRLVCDGKDGLQMLGKGVPSDDDRLAVALIAACYGHWQPGDAFASIERQFSLITGGRPMPVPDAYRSLIAQKRESQHDDH